MAYLIGTDEAGYAPNLGPLVISATVWQAPDGVGGEDLFERLAHVVASRLGRSAGSAVDGGNGRMRAASPHPSPLPEGEGTSNGRHGPDPGHLREAEGTIGTRRVVFADSKVLYSADKGLRHLERGLWAAMGLVGSRPAKWRDVWRAVAPDALDEMRQVPWYAEYDRPAPLDCDGEDLTLLAEPLRAGLEAVGVRLVAVRSRAIFAHEFNALVDRHGNKGAALSHETLRLVARMIESLPTKGMELVDKTCPVGCDSLQTSPSPFVSVICDKHGGRNRYADLLADHFPEQFIEIRGEGGRRSTYRFGPADRRIEFCFRVQAESCLPAALASMASKYLRELAMRAFNEFWRRHIPDLEPTAGYPVDAKRFRANIAKKQRELKIADGILWRER
ncbi:MAG: hypothetical protein LLG00_14460 [Planctomycetaceae bacterium]|nr:hypothetical protein [Planctomycetaceae bacterium]